VKAIHIRHLGPEIYEVTLVTEFHESVATATSIGQAFIAAADTIQVPVPEGLPRVLDLVRVMPATLDVHLTWSPR
jgi:hypothetical protein